MNTVNDKVIVILGASSGIGKATGREPADSLEGCTIACKAADVASYEDIKAVIDMAVELHGRVEFKVRAPGRRNWISGSQLIH